MFLYETQDIVIVEEMIHAVATHIRSFIWVWVSWFKSELPMRFGLIKN